MTPSCTRTRSPLRKAGAQSWVMTRVVPSSMTRVMRYMRSAPTELPVEPVLPVPPTVLPVPPAEVALVRGTTSISVTRLLGVAMEAVEVLDWSLGLLAVLPVLPVPPVTLLLPGVVPAPMAVPVLEGVPVVVAVLVLEVVPLPVLAVALLSGLLLPDAVDG